jgi:hypothetical protein
MSILNGFILKILKSASFSKEALPQMSIIVRQPYAYLEPDLQGIFKGQEDVMVRVDRRYGHRRMKIEPFSLERRRADRRESRETLIDVVISN